MPRSPLFVCCVVVAMLATPAHARPLKSVCDAMEPFRKISDLQYVKPVVRVKPRVETIKPADVTFTIHAKSGPIAFAPKPDGVIELPITDALCAENPQLVSNQPDDAIAFTVSIDPHVPSTTSLDYRQLDTLRREWSEAISRQNIMYRALAPSPKAYNVSFTAGRGASAEIRLPQGSRTLVADAKGEIVIPFEPAWAEANPVIVLSELPKRIGLKFKD